MGTYPKPLVAYAMIVFMEVQEHVGDTAETAVETTRMGM
jgi:hypothetical protein